MKQHFLVYQMAMAEDNQQIWSRLHSKNQMPQPSSDTLALQKTKALAFFGHDSALVEGSFVLRGNVAKIYLLLIV